jgi:mono/diheme cytochrome c family protein
MGQFRSAIFWQRVFIGFFAVSLVLVLFAIANPSSASGDVGATPTPSATDMPGSAGAGKMVLPAAWINPPPPGPTQADQGAYTFWMHCMVCHGDQGQGLAKFRSSYPKQDQNCSNSRCHGGPRPGAGFSFPDAPAIIGPGTLSDFKTAAQLYAFVSTRMPYQASGVLSKNDYWDVVAYLLRQNHIVPDGAQVSAANANSIELHSQSPNAVVIGVIAISLLAISALLVRRFRQRM